MELRSIIEGLFLLYSIEDVKRVNYIGNSAAFTTSRIDAVKEYLPHVEGIIYKTIKLPHKEKWDVYIWKEDK
jgi:hypothetical protein|nr:MAG TPA: hypothetical protein [Caudoviricetes sp.]